LSQTAFQIIILALCFVGAVSSFTILDALKPYKGKIMIGTIIVDILILCAFIKVKKKKKMSYGK
jgi:hypothetical protein